MAPLQNLPQPFMETNSQACFQSFSWVLFFFFSSFFWPDTYFFHLCYVETTITKVTVFECLFSLIIDPTEDNRGKQGFTVLTYVPECQRDTAFWKIRFNLQKSHIKIIHVARRKKERCLSSECSSSVLRANCLKCLKEIWWSIIVVEMFSRCPGDTVLISVGVAC